MNLPDNLVIYFDGSCGPKNPGGIAGFAYRILDENNNLIAENSGIECRNVPIATNNTAEWAAITHALRFLKENAWTGKLRIKGDSQLVIYQLTGKYQCKKPHLIPYCFECLEFLESCDWEAIWIAREENSETDQASRKF